MNRVIFNALTRDGRWAARALALIIGALAVSNAALAAPIAISGSATLTSDYRFRGISQSDSAPAVQANLEASGPHGVYAGLWTSTVSDAAQAGAPVELDGYVGIRKTCGAWEGDVGVQYYSYPGAQPGLGNSTAELYASLSTTLPKLSTNIRLSGAASPKRGQDARANLYAALDVAQPVPTTPLTIKGHVGATRAAGRSVMTALPAPTGNYRDYLFGVDYVRRPFTLGLALVGTDISSARAQSYPFAAINARAATKSKIIVSLTARF